MKKAIFIIASFAVLLISVSASTRGNRAPKGGYLAPSLVLDYNGSTVNLDELKGGYVLLTFWSSDDARSRLQCNVYETCLADDSRVTDSPVRMIAVNFDRSENLFREIVRRDCLNEETQFHAEGESAVKVMEDFALDNGLKTFLLDKDGRIIATNPSPEDLTKILNS